MGEALTLSRPLDGLRRNAARIKLRATSLWRAYPRETLGLGLLGLVGAGALATAIAPAPGLGGRAEAAAPAPPPLLVRQIAPEQAVQLNAQIPLSAGPNPAAAPFAFKGSADARAQALQCLASAVYYEAGREPDAGQRAVAQVVLNRVRHPAFADSVCGVVYEGSTRATGCQFTFTCDGSLYHQPDAIGWRRAYKVAEAALAGEVHAPVGWATHYHADYVVPYWAPTLDKNAIVGRHIFYRWAGSWGRKPAFVQRYAGREPAAVALRNAALAAEAATNAQAKLQEASAATTVAEAVEEMPGAEEIKLAPSLRGDKRVAIRFNLAARNAAEEAKHQDYAKKFDVSANLKFALSEDTVGAEQKPLGNAKAPAAPVTGSATVGSQPN